MAQHPDNRHYGERHYRYQAGTVALVRETQTLAPRPCESPAVFRARILATCSQFEATKRPDEAVGYIERWHDDQVTMATVFRAVDEPPAMSRQALDRFLEALLDRLPAVLRRRR